ncbi:MAG TPA: class I SAM-dependent methyltransferase [Acidimicrobiales bacterium]|nr:class I SAM-dependent methyltransferase [Acidimicrobiales bacterium]
MAGAETKQERQTLERFAARYRLPQNEATREVELAVIGGDWGANGYTTMAQADLLAEALGLRPGMRLLDLGAGRGWPGLYLAKRSGCAAVLSDVPVDGLRAGAARGRAEALSRRVSAVVASARHLPFGEGSFDAIVHTDVLC